MMRLNPEGYYRFVQTDRFEATYAGDRYAGYALRLGYLRSAHFAPLPDRRSRGKLVKK